MIQKIIDLLEREAGYHAIGMMLIILGIAVMDPTRRGEIGSDLVKFSLGFMARSMSSKRSLSGPLQSEVVDTHTRTAVGPEPPEPKGA